jgi:N-acetylglutamate synthase-like GNAT family acetyltransferase
MEGVVRDATKDDRDEVQAIFRAASLVWDDTREALLARPELLQLDVATLTNGSTRVVEVCGVVEGFSAVAVHDDQLDLEALFVRPAAFRRGLGRRLVLDVVARARRLGRPAVHVVANLNAGEFYRACGFAAVEPVETELGPAALMRVPVAP